MSRKLFLGQMLAATAMLMEAGGPPVVKERLAEREARLREQDEARRERNRQRLAREQAEGAALRAQTPDHVWDRIARDEKRRADKKAAKKAAKKAQR